MNNEMGPQSMNDRFDHMLAVMSGSRFLRMEGLNNEVPFFICPYQPSEAVAMDRTRGMLINQLGQKGVMVLEVNLYDLSIELLKEREIWEQVLEIEEETSKEELKELLQGVLDVEEHLVPAIADKMVAEPFDILFLSGIGEVFPYIRSHNVLNNLQSSAQDKPTVLFFPGVYKQTIESGASLDLFGIPNDDKYYRAFNIFLREA